MGIHVYCMCLNEEAMIPYFLAHYYPIVDKIFVFDNGSTDRSLDLLKGDEKIVLQSIDNAGQSFLKTYSLIMNEAWMQSREVADWIITAEMDEHLHHPDLPGYLAHCRKKGVTFLRAIGYDMISDAFPSDPRALWRQIVHGARSKTYDKPALFDPKAITAVNYDSGRHSAEPEGRVVFEPQRQVKLLHYKSLGLDYVCARNLSLSAGVSAEDREARQAIHYLRDRAQTEKDLANIRAFARRVPGLHTSETGILDLTFADELDRIAESGLFDEAFYREKNPDVAAAEIDPLEHYCAFGWREGRRPNAYFDVDWYRLTYADKLSPHVNPLVDYILRGEALGRFPQVSFDPEAYRLAQGLPADTSALRHRLGRMPADSRVSARIRGAWDHRV